MKLKSPSAYWSELDEKRRSEYRIVAAVLLGIFTLFTAIAVGSYLFTWKQDASLLSESSLIDSDVEVHNASSKLGFRWGHFLVTRSFGLAALGLVAFFVAWTLSRFVPKMRISLGKWFIYSFTGTFIGSWLLALVSRLAGWDTLFGGGLGGRAGGALVDGSINLVGYVVTAIALLALAGLWVYFVSGGFPALTSPSGDEEPEPEPAYEPEPEPEPEPKPERKPRFAFVREKKAQVDPVVVEEPAPVVEEPVEPAPASTEEGTFTVQTDDTLEQAVKEPLPRIDNRLDPDNGGLPKFKFPTLDILGDYLNARHEPSQDELNRNNNKIRATLASYKIQVKDVTAIVGPTVTLYKVYPAPGVKIASIKMLQDDIAISLNAKGVRIVTLSDSVGIEVANDTPSIVPLKQLLNDDAYRNSKAELPVAIGYTISQKVKVFDLADAPHLLVAGATKQGKSVGLNVIVSSLLYSKHPSELKFVFIDPKMVEFSAYSKLINHYLAVLPTAADEQDERDNAIVKNAKSASSVLQSLCVEMDERYSLLNKAGVNNIKLYNDKYRDRHLLPTEGHRFLPYIVVVIDEYADLTMSVGAGPESKAIARSITTSVIRLAQKGRAAGLHVILATQRPTVDVITGLIKANFPMRIAFRVTSRIDSSTILDQPGADKLIGRGDMLLYSGVEMERIQCAFIGNDEIATLTDSIGSQIGYQKSYNTPFYLPEPPSADGEGGEGGGMVDMKSLDERFEEAARLVVTSQRGSTSDLQRRLGMGYAKAGRVMDQLEAAGVVGPQNGSKPREVLVKDFNELDQILSHFLNGEQ
ncbi:MAG: DNA translocase FtsK [Bacteroidales bacterium]|nr:DNA translocase FtsK [Bacteroidales bacterium]